MAAGGTGGHLFPAEALAAELTARGCRVVLMTDGRSGGLHGFASGEAFVLRGAGIAGRGALRAGQAAVALAAGTVQARGILGRLNAAAVVGFGGYPSVAPVLASRSLRRRPAVVLHEQNAVLGRANRQMARFADALALGVADTRRVPAGVRTIHTGNPVRPAVLALAGVAYVPPADGTINLLVTGGSLGARVFSDAVPAAVALLPAGLRARLRITQQCRAEDLDRVRAAYAAASVPAELAAFFADLPDRLATAHFVIARAGAGTVAELCAIGRPALLVPLPGAIDNHQAFNARASGAEVLDQAIAADPAALAGALARSLLDPAGLSDAAARIAAHAIPDAAARLADLVEQAVHTHTQGAQT
jgi:UDP-N-acetylglucosamine--N-acetylmuramyl-(pentapeptide) pyrophosphoryl-undecaprenol N-acetylglucosamine transferase